MKRRSRLRGSGLLPSGLLTAGLLLACYLLQTAILPHLRILGVAPLLLPLLPAAAGLLGGGLWGGVTGLAAGLLCDASLGGQSLLFAVWLTAAGFFAGFLGEFALAQGFPSFVLLSLGALLASAGLQLLHPLLAGCGTLWPLVRTGLLQTGYSMLFVLPTYAAVRRALRPWLRRRRD